MRNKHLLTIVGAGIILALLASAAWAASLPAGSRTTDPWQPLTPPPGGWVRSFVASPHFLSDRTLFAGTEGALSRSTDAGITWIEVGPGPYGPIGDVRQIVLSPQYPIDPTIFLWACPYGPGDYGCSLLRSMDNGEAWQAISDVEHHVADIAISPDYAVDHMLFVANVTDEGGEILRSTDHGDTWQVVHEFGDSLYWFRIGLSPNFAVDSTLFAIGYGAMQRSTDGGNSWTTLTAPNPNYNLAISPHFATDHTLWVMYREIEASGQRPDSGVSWSIRGPAGAPGGRCVKAWEEPAAADPGCRCPPLPAADVYVNVNSRPDGASTAARPPRPAGRGNGTRAARSRSA